MGFLLLPLGIINLVAEGVSGQYLPFRDELIGVFIYAVTGLYTAVAGAFMVLNGGNLYCLPLLSFLFILLLCIVYTNSFYL